MSTHNICFYGELTKIIIKYPPYLFHSYRVTLHKNVCCGYSIELSWQGESNSRGPELLSMISLRSVKMTSF